LDGAGRRVPPHLRRIGCVFQDPALFPHLTVRQNLSYGRRFSHRSGLNVDEVVDLLDLGPLLDRRPAGLSGGERSRTAIGRALLSDPDLLLLDEPLAALDDGRKADILPYLERLRDGVALPMIYVSHALPEVARLANHIVVLQAGKVLRSGPTADVLSDPHLSPALGLRDAGAVITARLIRVEEDGLAVLETAAGLLYLPGVRADVGQVMRLRIPAQDVILSREKPTGLSALNILAAEVVSLTPIDPTSVMVDLRLVDQTILARITTRSATALALTQGTPCFAILKSVAIAGSA
jgi:molybdate transport system ATP-binding protein